MSTFKIPNQNGHVRQLNLNDTAGELFASRNIDLRTTPGKIKLARPFKQVATATQLSSDLVTGFAQTQDTSGGDILYAITDANLYSSSYPFTSWTVVSSLPSFAEDCTVFNGQLIISGRIDLDAWDFDATYTEDWWTARGNPTLTASNPSTVLRVLETARVGAETLIVLDGSNVYGYTGGITSGVITSVTLDLDSALMATCFKSGIRAGWIGTQSYKADQAYVIQWDCTSTNYTQAFPVGSKAVMAIELIDDVPIIVTESGEIKKFNNAGFTTVAQFPFATKEFFATQWANVNGENRPIHPKGMKRYGNTLYIHVNYANSDITTDIHQMNGLWALDLTTYSLTHLGATNSETYWSNQNASPVMLINNRAGRILLSGRRDADLTTSKEGIYIENLDNDTYNYGYVVTSEINSSGLKDSFVEVVVKAALGAEDEVEVKYRTSKDFNYPITITNAAWTGLQPITFTSVSDLSNVSVGDEIEIMAGYNAGRLAHITAISENTGTYTVTVDEQIGLNGQTSYIRFDNWRKVPKTMTSVDGDMVRFGLGSGVGTFMQAKVALKGKAGNPEIREISIKSNPKEQL